TPYSGEFHFTALCTPGSVRVISASMRRPMSCLKPGIASMYAFTGASPKPIGICGLPPESRTIFSGAFHSPFAVFFAIGLLPDCSRAFAFWYGMRGVVSDGFAQQRL